MRYNKVIFMHKSISLIERWLDGVPMYRVVTLALLFLVLSSVILGQLGIVVYTGFEQLVSLLVAVSVGLMVNWFCSWLFRAHVNMESAFITALIVFFLVLPAESVQLADSWIIAAVVAIGIFSKFIIVWRKQHIINPAAAGALGLAVVYIFFPVPGYFEAVWWIGRPELFLPLVLAGGVVVYKIRKWVPVSSFLVVGFLVFLFEEWKFMGDLSNAAGFWLSGPSLFLAFFMLTEPFTMPPTKNLQALYGAVVGLISQTTLFLPLGIKITPELALIVGNVLFFPATLRQKLFLKLVSVREVALHTYEFVFHKPRSFIFAAGQYLEWMLPHTRPDNRGIRRYFTVASAPEEDFVRLGIRFGATVSTYKSALLAMQPGDTIIASQRAGDFLLPSDSSKKLGFIAGGIGITPFISHLESMSRGQTKNNTVLFYCNNTSLEIAYHDRLQALALVLPLRLVHILVKEKREGFESGFLDAEMIRRKSPDYLERHWYLSGPPGMVNAYSQLLLELGVPRSQILKDFFPGLA